MADKYSYDRRSSDPNRGRDPKKLEETEKERLALLGAAKKILAQSIPKYLAYLEDQTEVKWEQGKTSSPWDFLFRTESGSDYTDIEVSLKLQQDFRTRKWEYTFVWSHVKQGGGNDVSFSDPDDIKNPRKMMGNIF